MVYVLKERFDDDYNDKFTVIYKSEEAKNFLLNGVGELEDLKIESFDSLTSLCNFLVENSLKVEEVYGTDSSLYIYPLK